MKGIILAGGSGSRLYPITKGVSKQLLPIYDKPMIFYPLSVLMLAGIKEILIISTPEDLPNFKTLLGNGNELGLKLSFKVQPSPDGLAQAFIIGEDFIGSDDVCLILGDNIFYGNGFSGILKKAKKNIKNGQSTIFGYYVNNPREFGVVDFDQNNNIKSIKEKPKNPASNYAVVGLYFYTNNVVKISKKIKPSSRGELEITSINEEFLKLKSLKVALLGRGFAWLDTGTHNSLIEASKFIETIEKRQGFKIACLEEIAYRMKYISLNNLRSLGKKYNNQYGKYILSIKKDED